MIKNFTLLAFCCLLAVSLYAQQPIHQLHPVLYTYIFKLKQAEAEKFYRQGTKVFEFEDTVLHTLVDSFPKNQSYSRHLPFGHYLFVMPEMEQLRCDIESVVPFKVNLFNNQTDFALSVLDTAGGIISSARVELEGKKVPYDRATKSYQLRKSKHTGLLEVSDGRYTAFWNIEKKRGNYRISFARKVFYSRPLRWFWLTPWNLTLGPWVRLIRAGYPTGYLRPIVAVFNPDYRRDRDYEREQRRERKEAGTERKRKLSGYIAFNKPRFLPGDTVRIKAFITDYKDRPLQQPVRLQLHADQYRELAVLKPERPGAYTYTLVLHDSLRLRLDRTVSIFIFYKDHYLSNDFYYEDYQLNELTFELSAVSKEHQPGEPLVLIAKATDSNQLPVADATIQLTAVLNSITGTDKSGAILPDTLWQHSQPLDAATAETRIFLPDSLLHGVYCSYTIHATLTNSNNELHRQKVKVDYVPGSVNFRLENGWLYIEDSRQSPATPSGEFTLTMWQNRQKRAQRSVMLPFREKINPAVSFYSIQNDRFSSDFFARKMPMKITCYTRRTKDSLWLDFDNPHRLPFHYYLYLKDKEIFRGSDSTDLKIGFRAQEEKYFLSLQYMAWGEIKNEEISIPYEARLLNLQVSQPELVNPGQKATIDVSVTDQQNKPVANVDLTAFAYTQKFGEQEVAKVPRWFANTRGRTCVAEFKMIKPGFGGKSVIQWDRWKPHLESSPVYSFLYPEQGRYEFYTQKVLNTATFSPFVFDQGMAITIHTLSIDDEVVYFKAYRQMKYVESTEGYHRVRLRLYDREIVVDSVWLQKGKNLLMSVDAKNPGRNVTITALPDTLTPFERAAIDQKTVVFRNVQQGTELRYDSGYNLSELREKGQALLLPFDKGAVHITIPGLAKDTMLIAEPGWEYHLPVRAPRKRFFEDRLFDVDTTGLLPRGMLEKHYRRVWRLRPVTPWIADQYSLYQGAFPVTRLEWEFMTAEQVAWKDLPVEQQWNIALNKFPAVFGSGYTYELRALPKNTARYFAGYRGKHQIRKMLLSGEEGKYFFQAIANITLIEVPAGTYTVVLLTEQGYMIREKVNLNHPQTLVQQFNDSEMRQPDSWILEVLKNNFLDTSGFSVKANASQVNGGQELEFHEALQGRLAGVSISRHPTNSDRNPEISATAAPQRPQKTTVSTGELLKLLRNRKEISQLRTRFSDYAYWQPLLVTDRNGKASFEVQFPDDITGWQTHILAMGSRRHSGQMQGEIRAVKQLQARLEMPSFLVQGDTATVIGKSVSYREDTTGIKTVFEQQGRLLSSRNHQLNRSAIDNQIITTPATDTLNIKYILTREKDGYFDGEVRKLPVLPQGVKESTGTFLYLPGDTTATVAPFEKGTGKIYIKSGVLEALLEEIGHVKSYPYDCNEQSASKLKMLLMEKQIRTLLGQPFDGEKEIRKIIDRLTKTQYPNGSWGWWPSSPESPWMTCYVSETLMNAQKAGYQTGADLKQTGNYLQATLKQFRGSDVYMALKTLARLNPQIDLKLYEDQLKDTTGTLIGHLQLLELKQMGGMRYSLDTLKRTAKQTMLKGLYWGNPDLYYGFSDQSIQATLLAYRLLRNQGGNDRELAQIQRFFFEAKRNGYWRNTWESASIPETILPDFLKDQKPGHLAPQVILSGAVNQKVQQFPFEADFKAGDTLKIQKTGLSPLFVSVSQTYWNPNPEKQEKDFRVKTWFGENPENQQFHLEAGKPAVLTVEVTALSNAGYVMVEVPIPAGCMYDRKITREINEEVHREYFKHQAAVFFEQLPKGKYVFHLYLQPRFSGTYTLNPARAELMYFPVFFGREESKKVTIK